METGGREEVRWLHPPEMVCVNRRGMEECAEVMMLQLKLKRDTNNAAGSNIKNTDATRSALREGPERRHVFAPLALPAAHSPRRSFSAERFERAF